MPVSHLATGVQWPPLSTEMRTMRPWTRLLEAARARCSVVAGSEGGTALPHVEVRTGLCYLHVPHPPGGLPHLLLEVLGRSSIPQQLDPSAGQTHTGDDPLGPQRADATSSHLHFA